MEDELERIGSRGEEEATPPTPITITDSTFHELVGRHPLVVVDCWAPWCFPCRLVAPIVEELARDYAGRVVFGKLNVDENRRTAAEYGVMSIPTLLIAKNGKVVDRIVGAAPKHRIEERLRRYL